MTTSPLDLDRPTTITVAPPSAGDLAVGELRAGDRLDRYVIVRPLGAGGMGTVYEAFDPTLRRRLAIKALHPTLATGGGAATALMREAEVLARLSHPNVVHVYDVVRVGGSVALTMELVAGLDGQAWLRALRRPWADVLARFLDAGRGLAAAHAVGLVHRDFKPANMLIGDDGRVRITDFGIATAIGDGARVALGSPADSGLRSGFAGTPWFAAPEQHRRAAIDARADQFAFCAALWLGLYRQMPYDEVVVRGLATGGEVAIAPPPSGHGVPGWIEPLLRRGLATDPAARHRDLPTLLAALAPRRGRRRWLALSTALLAGAVIAAVVATRAGRSAAIDPCAHADQAVHGVWSPATRAALVGAFATDAPGAAAVGDRVGDGIERHARAWSAMRIGACRANRERGEQSDALFDRRMQCLDRRLIELAAMIDTFTRAPSRPIIDNAVAAVDRLELDACADRAALLAEVPAPATAAARAAVTDVLDRAAAIEGRLQAGQVAGLDGAIAPVVAAAEATGWPRAIAVALQLAGLIDEHRGAFAAARARSRAAALAAARAHDDRLTARALVVEAQAAVAAGDVAAGVELVRLAELPVARLGEPGAATASYYRSLGDIEVAAGHLDAAAAAYAAAIAPTARAFGADTMEQASLLHGRAVLAYRQDRFTAARALEQQAYAIVTARLGEDHPATASSLILLGNLALAAGDAEQAIADFRAALAIKRRILGAVHPSIAGVLQNLGNALTTRRRWDEALAAYREAQQIWTATVGADHPQALATAYSLAAMWLEQGRFADAEAALGVVLARREAILAADDPAIATTLDALGHAAAGRHDSAAALGYLTRALALRERELASDDPDLAATLAAIADVQVERGRWRDARAAASRALAILDRLPPADVDAASRAQVAATLARASAAIGPVAGR